LKYANVPVRRSSAQKEALFIKHRRGELTTHCSTIIVIIVRFLFLLLQIIILENIVSMNVITLMPSVEVRPSLELMTPWTFVT